MPKAAPGSRVSLRSAGAEGVDEGGFEEGQTEGRAALEAVSELDGKFEGWHLQAKQDAADAKAESAASQAAVQKDILALTALVAQLAQPPERVYGRARGSQEGDPPEGGPSPEPEGARPEPGRTTPERLTRSDPIEKAEDELLRLKGLIEREENRRANLAGEEPRVLFVEDVEGGGGVGRGVFYTGLSREEIDIPYLRRPYRRASSTYVAQVEGEVEDLQLPSKKIIKAEGLIPHYEYLQEESQNEADYLWFGLGRFRDVLASVQACGFFALGHKAELETVCSLLEERLAGIVEKAKARGDKDSVYDEDDSRMRARERRDAREEREYMSQAQKQEEEEFKASVRKARIQAKVKVQAQAWVGKKSTGAAGGRAQGGSGVGGGGRGRGNQNHAPRNGVAGS